MPEILQETENLLKAVKAAVLYADEDDLHMLAEQAQDLADLVNEAWLSSEDCVVNVIQAA